MKKKILLSIFAMLTLAVGVFAYTFTLAKTTSHSATSCCSGDSCPLKKMNAGAKETASCCDNCDCCSGDSCPMKVKDASTTVDSAQPTATAEAKSCSCSCCGKDKEKKDASAV